MPHKSSVRTAFTRRGNLRLTASILCLAAASLGLSAPANAAPTYTVLYSFNGKPNDGDYANGSLVQDNAGDLYGTTFGGGPYDFGTAFRLDQAGNETVLTDFDYANGIGPGTGLIRYNGNLYDTVTNGGYNNAGAIVSINKRGKTKLLYNFCSLANCTDGSQPLYNVTVDGAGNLYGVTEFGGAYGWGTVFKLDSAGVETVLYSFCPNGGACSDGKIPQFSGALGDSGGNLYGYAEGGPNMDCAGGNGQCGVVWKLDPAGTETVLHAFTGAPSDGYQPRGLLAVDGNGNLYGITLQGGSGTACGRDGCGTVFKIDASGTETVLYNFAGGTDGYSPGNETLVLDRKGNLYGTATYGGKYGYGTAFKLNSTGNFKVLHSFTGQSDGAYPQSGLLLDKQGALYGEAAFGGDLNCSEEPGRGCGVVFKITNP